MGNNTIFIARKERLSLDRMNALSDGVMAVVITLLILIPAFGNVNGQKAQSVLFECFPDRAVVPIPVVNLTAEGGAIHCVTQQQPAALGEINRLTFSFAERSKLCLADRLVRKIFSRSPCSRHLPC